MFGGYLGEPEMYDSYEKIKTEPFHEFILEKPPFEKGEKVYINELDITVSILDVVRSTDGKYIYYTNHEIKTIEDEETVKSKENAEKLFAQELDLYNKWQNPPKEELKKQWYQFWK
jgi:hypothetical protein